MWKSIIQYCAQHDSYRCGYCNSPDTNFSHGMWAHSLSVNDYQDLIDRGWRRSGKYCYKPTMDVTCCPMYTIRCKVQEFKASKSQKKILKRFNKYLSAQETPKHNSKENNRKMSTCSSDSDQACGEGREQFVLPKKEYADIKISDINPGEQILETGADAKGEDTIKNSENKKTKFLKVERNNLNENLKVIGPDPTKKPCMKAKLIRKEHKLEKLKAKGVDVSTLESSNRNKEKQLEDFLSELPEKLKHKLEIKLVRTEPPSPEWLATAKETHQVYSKYQQAVHGDKPEKCSEPRFKDFLVESPLVEEHSASAPACGYGSFHQQYWLDGRIVAVGVIDILPKCVSSVYFFYDPDYMSLTLGTYGALRELAFTRDLLSRSPDLKYYYMGYYVHSCRKMRYKGNFSPSDLLCPETYKWFPIADCIPKLDRSPYSRLDDDIDSIDENSPKPDDIKSIPILHNGRVIPFNMCSRTLIKIDKDIRDELRDYAVLVGAKTVRNLVYVNAK